jgi:transposase
MGKRRRNFAREFKEETVRLITEGGRSISQVAEDLDISESVIRRWKKLHEADPRHAFPGKGRLKPEEEEIRRLKRELARVQEERDILKKVVTIFSKEPK